MKFIDRIWYNSSQILLFSYKIKFKKHKSNITGLQYDTAFQHLHNIFPTSSSSYCFVTEFVLAIVKPEPSFKKKQPLFWVPQKRKLFSFLKNKNIKILKKLKMWLAYICHFLYSLQMLQNSYDLVLEMSLLFGQSHRFIREFHI